MFSGLQIASVRAPDLTSSETVRLRADRAPPVMLLSAVRRAASAQPQSLQTLLSPNRAPAPAYMNAAKNRVLENQIKFQAQSDIPVYLRGRGKMYFRA